MMNDLISRRAAIDAVEFGITYAKAINKDTGETIELFKQANEELRKAVERINQLPSAQPVRCEDCATFSKTRLLIPQPDHIRCRDCKYAEFKPGATIHCKMLSTDLYQWDYCSYAERRTDE